MLHVSVFEQKSVYCSSKSVESVKPAKFSSLYDKKVLRGVQLKPLDGPCISDRVPFKLQNISLFYIHTKTRYPPQIDMVGFLRAVDTTAVM